MEQAILSHLTELNGNVQAVASRLGISESYVHRIKRDRWKPTPQLIAESAPPLTPPPEVTALDTPSQAVEAATSPDINSLLLSAIIPPNVAAIKNLRDLTINELELRIQAGLLGEKQLVGLLKTLLNFETDSRQAIKPALAIYQDNRTQTYQTLMRKLDGYDRADLLALAPGVETVDGEFTE